MSPENQATEIATDEEVRTAKPGDGSESLPIASERPKIVGNIGGGEIGGVGKSTFIKTMAYYYQKKAKSVIVVDCDRTNHDVWNMYKENEIEAAHRLELSDNTEREDAADEILNWAAEKETPVLVNLPAQADTNIRSWIDRTVLPIIQLPASERDVDIQLNYWFVTNGSKESIDLFLDSLQHYGGHIQHLLVRNYGTGSNWESVDSNPYLNKLTQKIIRLPKVKNGSAVIERPKSEQKDAVVNHVDEIGKEILPIVQMEFPRLAKRERDKLNAEGISFRQALSTSNDNGRKPWPLWERSRLYAFTSEAAIVFAETGLLP